MLAKTRAINITDFRIVFFAKSRFLQGGRLFSFITEWDEK